MRDGVNEREGGLGEGAWWAEAREGDKVTSLC